MISRNDSLKKSDRQGSALHLDRITTDPARMNGQPCIRNLRITARRVIDALQTYPNRAEFFKEYPELEEEDINQALAFTHHVQRKSEHL